MLASPRTHFQPSSKRSAQCADENSGNYARERCTTGGAHQQRTSERRIKRPRCVFKVTRKEPQFRWPGEQEVCIEVEGQGQTREESETLKALSKDIRNIRRCHFMPRSRMKARATTTSSQKLLQSELFTYFSGLNLQDLIICAASASNYLY